MVGDMIKWKSLDQNHMAEKNSGPIEELSIPHVITIYFMGLKIVVLFIYKIKSAKYHW